MRDKIQRLNGKDVCKVGPDRGERRQGTQSGQQLSQTKSSAGARRRLCAPGSNSFPVSHSSTLLVVSMRENVGGKRSCFVSRGELMLFHM